jgi:hypothetical protein
MSGFVVLGPPFYLPYLRLTNTHRLDTKLACVCIYTTMIQASDYHHFTGNNEIQWKFVAMF